MVAQQRRQQQSTKKTQPKPPRPEKRAATGIRWEQRRQEILRRERSMALVLAFTSFIGTLCLLYVSAHGNATLEGYQLKQLQRRIQHEQRESLRLQAEIRKIEDGSALALEAERLQLIRSVDGAHYFSKPQKEN